MLTEIKDAQQIDGEPPRRWFCDDIFDLIVWFSSSSKIQGFQLCYHEDVEEKALTWTEERGFSHNTIDDGEARPARHKMTPILVPDGVFHRDHILRVFIERVGKMEPQIVDFVVKKLSEYGKQTT